MNPLVEVYHKIGKGPAANISGSSAAGSHMYQNYEEVNYQRALGNVLDIWPEYSPLSEISTPILGQHPVEILQSVYTRLFEQHTFIKTLSNEKHEMHQELLELREENETVMCELQDKENKLETLNYDIGILKGNLRRHGLDPGVRDRDSRNVDFGEK